LGFRIFPGHRLLKKQNQLYMRRKLKKLQTVYREGNIALDQLSQSIRSWVSHAKYADSYKVRSRILSSVVFKRDAAAGAAGRLLEQQS
jgi:hypothetical protein